MSPSMFPTQHAAVLHAAKDLRLEERIVWSPKPGEVQVQIASTGLCGSDLHYYKHGRNGEFAVRQPLVLGHEASGIVTAVGAGVTGLVVGQRVAIEAGIMCRKCSFCQSGRYNLCKSMRFCSSAAAFPHVDGTLQTRINHPAHVVHPLPDTCSFEQAALAEPLSVLVHASRRAELTAGQSVLVLGTGAIGVLACAHARSLGASRVAAIDINQTRLDFAKKNGFADQTYCFPPADSPKNAEEQLRRAKENASLALAALDKEDGFDVVFECSGAEPCIQMSIHAATTGGKVMLIGMGTKNATLPLSSAALREVDIHGSFRYANTYPAALELLSSRKLGNVEKLVTHRFKLQDAKKAFETLERGVDEDGRLVLKVMIGDGQVS